MTRTALRPLPLVATATLLADRHAKILPSLPPAPAPAPVAGDVEVAVPRLDGAGRLQITGIARRLGWTPGAAVTGRIDLATTTVTLGVTASGPADAVSCPLDPKGRLGLPAGIRHALGLAAGTQALVVALPDPDRVLIQPANRVLSTLTTPAKETPTP